LPATAVIKELEPNLTFAAAARHRNTIRSLEVEASIPFVVDDLNLVQSGAHERNRTFDLTLTKGVLYRLSYGGVA
jgi:hypothetical protein